jgi:hypothetical protein
LSIAWDDIGRVLGRKSAGLIEIEPESTAGIHLLLRSDWHGFADVIEAMAARLADMPPAWLGRIEQVRPGHALWRRGWAIAGESPGPDGMPVTAWHRIVP